MKSKHVNILNERPRRKNNKILLNIGMCEKPKKRRGLGGSTESISIAPDVKIDIKDTLDKIEKYGQSKYTETGKVEKPFYNIWEAYMKLENPEKEPELNFWQASVLITVVFLALFTGFKLLQRAMDINALQNCEEKGDCVEVIRDINGR